MDSRDHAFPVPYPGSVLARASAADVVAQPFPHLVIRDAIPASLAAELTRRFPIEIEGFQDLPNNARADLSISDVQAPAAADLVPEAWKAFLAFHSSQSFLDQLVEVFSEEILRAHPRTYRSLKTLRSLRAGRRGVDSFQESDLLLDAQVSVNAPVTAESSVRGVHVDLPNKLFSGLFYLRQPDDPTTGGNLRICKWNDRYSLRKKLALYKEPVDPVHTQVVKEIPYENNLCILFLNSLDALHSVTPRPPTPHHRTFVNLIGEAPSDLYRIRPSSRAHPLRKIVRTLTTRLSKKRP